jgi:hypothetical protein
VSSDQRTDAYESTYKRPMLDCLDTPVIAEMERLNRSDDPLDRAIFELWRGRSVVSSVTAARLPREQADALLRALGEMP